MPVRKYASPEEAKEAARARQAEYRKTYVLTDEQRQRYNATARGRYADDPDYRASKIERNKVAEAKRRVTQREARLTSKPT